MRIYRASLTSLALVFVSAFSFGQNVRFDVDFTSILNKGNTPYVVANIPPNSPKLSVCSSPANGLPCTNYATSYTSTGAACPNGAQDTPNPQPSACQATADAQGNLGFWAPPGRYDYTVCVANNCYGPYTITLGGSTGVASFNSRTGAIFPQAGDYNVSQVTGAAPLASPTFTGSLDLSFIVGPQCLQADPTGHVLGTGLPCGSGGGGGTVSSVFTRTGAVVANTGDYTVGQVSGAAPLASPTFTGTVGGITAAMVGLGNVTNDTQTQAAVMPNTPPSPAAIPIGNAGGTAYAPIVLTGDATITSAGVVTNNALNGIAVSGTPSTGYVPTATGSTAATWQAPAVASVFGRTGVVVAATNDYSEAQISFTNITTNDVSITKHGYAPKAPNDATKFLDGTGAYSTPAGSGNVSNVGTPTSGQVGVWTGTTTLSGVTPTGTGTPVFSTSPTFITGLSLSGAADGCAHFVSTVLSSTGSACGAGGGMVWPAGSGIPVVVAGASWGTTLAQSGTGSVAMTGSPTFTGTVAGITATMVGLGSVSNDAQTKAAIVPNTAPSAGQLLIGNAGGTAYAPISLSGDGTVTSAGVLTNTKLNGLAVPLSASVLGSNGSRQLIAAMLQGNGAKVQLSTGTTTLNDCVKFDSNGNTVDAGAACGNLVSSVFARTGAVVATSGDYSVGQVTGAAPLASPTFTGTVTTPALTLSGFSTGCLTNTAGVVSSTGVGCGAAAPVTSVFSRTGAVVATSGDYSVAQVTGAAPLASPTFTGTVAGITASMVGLGSVTNDAQTKAAIVPNTPPAASAILIGNAGGTAYAPMVVSGDSTMTSAGVMTNTKINGIGVTTTPSTGNVLTATGSTAATWQAPAVGSVFGRTGTVVAATNDYSFAQISGNLALGQIPTGGSSSTFLRGDGSWQTPAGAGNVTNVGTPTNGQIAQWTGATSIQGLNTTGTGSVARADSPVFTTQLSLTGYADGCASFASTVLISTGSACGAGGGMVWPAGSGIPVVSGGASWGTTLSQSGTGSVAMTGSPTFTGTVSGITATMVGLGSVTNDVQTKNSIVPNTLPAAGQILIGNAGGTAYAKNSLSGDGTLTSAGVLTNTRLNGAAVPTAATVLGSNGSNQLIAATVQGNGSKVQLSTGTTTTNDCAKFDASGNVIDNGSPCANTVASVFGRTGAIVSAGGDYSVGQVTGAAPLASPTFTGTVSGITATMVGLGNVTNDTQTKASIVPNTGLVAGKLLVVNAGATAYAPVALSGDSTITAAGAITNVRLNGAAIPASATVLGSNGATQLVSATVQGNGAKVQLSTGSAVTNALVQYDASGNAIPSTVTTATGSGNSVKITPNLFAAIGACTSGIEGTMAPVTDSTTQTWGATITGGGALHVLAYCDGSAWSVMAK